MARQPSERVTEDLPPQTAPGSNVAILGFNNPTTGLPSATSLTQFLHKHITDTPANEIVYLGMEVSRVREITSLFGPEAHERYLKEAADRLKVCLPDNGHLFHVQGAVFGIVIIRPAFNVTDGAVKAILRAFGEPIDIGGVPFPSGITIGIAHCPNHATEANGLRQAAAAALRAALVQYKPYAIYNRTWHDGQRRTMALLSDLKGAIRNDDLELHYQPKVELEHGRCTGAEALVRWQHPQHGLLGPGSFIIAAENTLLINDITAWVLDRGLRQLRRWHDEGLSIQLSINLSARNLQDMRLPQAIRDWLDFRDVPPESLELEITETAAMAKPELSTKMLRELREIGVSLAIDDFGSGHSSLAYLSQLPITTWKIDQMFGRTLDDNPTSAKIIKAAVGLASELGLKTVVEGVEQSTAYETVKRIGADEVQGYHVCRPLPADDFATWHRKRARSLL